MPCSGAKSAVSLAPRIRATASTAGVSSRVTEAWWQRSRARLPTERPDPRSRDLDRLSPAAVARLMNRADHEAVTAVARAAPEIGRGVELIAQALSDGGRLIFVGAGTSGRLGVLEAAECPPT